MPSSENLNELAAALSEAQSEFGAVAKDSENPFFHSSYASLASVVKTATPVISKHGLSVSQHLGFDSGVDTLTTWLLHSSGQWIKDTMRLHLVKQDPQSQGSATSYAKRYAYMAVLGLVADDDDDGNAASSGPAREPKISLAELKAAADRAGATKEDVEGYFKGKFNISLADANQVSINAATDHFTQLSVQKELSQ